MLSLLILALYLLHGALAWILLQAPPQEFSPMTESAAGEVIKLHFRHQLGFERLPLHRMFCAPAAQPARRFSRKSWGLDYFLQLFGQCQALVRLDRRAESHMVQQILLIVEAQQ